MTTRYEQVEVSDRKIASIDEDQIRKRQLDSLPWEQLRSDFEDVKRRSIAVSEWNQAYSEADQLRRSLQIEFDKYQDRKIDGEAVKSRGRLRESLEQLKLEIHHHNRCERERMRKWNSLRERVPEVLRRINDLSRNVPAEWVEEEESGEIVWHKDYELGTSTISELEQKASKHAQASKIASLLSQFS